MEVFAKNLRRFKVITFDCTNTLLKFTYPTEVKYLKIAQEFGIPMENFDKNLVKQNFRKEIKELSQKHPNFGRDTIKYNKWWQTIVTNVLVNSAIEPIDSKLMKPIAEKLVRSYQTKECWEHYEKSIELIADLKQINKTVGMISNFDTRLHALLADINLPKVDFVVTSYEVGFEKPDPQIFNHALKLGGKNVQPSECLHIGNELEKDFNGATNAGWSAVLINSEDKVEPSFASIEDFYQKLKTKEINL